MPLTELGDSSAQVTAVEGRTGTHIVRVPVADGSGTPVVFGYLVWLEIVSGNAILRTDPVFMESAEATFPDTIEAQASDVDGRARTEVIRVPLNDTGTYAAWAEFTAAGGVVTRSQPVVCTGGTGVVGGGGGDPGEWHFDDPVNSGHLLTVGF